MTATTAVDISGAGQYSDAFTGHHGGTSERKEASDQHCQEAQDMCRHRRINRCGSILSDLHGTVHAREQSWSISRNYKYAAVFQRTSCRCRDVAWPTIERAIDCHGQLPSATLNPHAGAVPDYLARLGDTRRCWRRGIAMDSWTGHSCLCHERLSATHVCCHVG